MLPYILGSAAALALLGGRALRRRKHHVGDPRTAETKRLRIVDSRHATTRRMARVNPKGLIGVDKDGIRWSVKKNYETGEWMIVAYVNGKRHEGKTYYTDDKDDAVNTFNHLMSTRGGTVVNPKHSPERVRRIQLAKRETQELLDKEMRYSSHLRKKDYLKFLRGHLRKLDRMAKNPGRRGAWLPNEHEFHIDVSGGILAAYWFDDGRWLLRYKGTIVARGDGYRPAPSHRHSDKKSGLGLIELAVAALPGSGSGIAGDKDSLKAWTEHGIKALDRSEVHDEISLLVSDSEEQSNPKRRTKKVRRKVKGQWRTVTTITKTVKKTKTNPVHVPKGYKSAAGTRLRFELKHSSSSAPIRALKIAKMVARQNGDHTALKLIDVALVAASANRSLPQAVAIARRTARMLGH